VAGRRHYEKGHPVAQRVDRCGQSLAIKPLARRAREDRCSSMDKAASFKNQSAAGREEALQHSITENL
jgi:hypothetical protein